MYIELFESRIKRIRLNMSTVSDDTISLLQRGTGFTNNESLQSKVV